MLLGVLLNGLAGLLISAGPASLPVVDVGLGRDTSCAVMADGSVRCWGRNAGGVLLPFATQERDAATPITIPGVTDALAIHIGGEPSVPTVCVLRRQGTVLCWGSAALVDGREGRLTTPTELPGVTPVAEVGLGRAHGCARGRDKLVRCWGWRMTVGTRRRPSVAVFDPPALVEGLGPAERLSVGEEHACAVTPAARVRCWGHTDLGGKLGDGGEQDRAVAVEVPGLTGVVDVVATSGWSCAARRNGSVWCWGIGYGRRPRRLTDVSGAKELSAHPAGGHACARRASGRPVCWGANVRGQLGVGQVGPARPEGVVAASLGIDATVYPGSDHACAVLTDGQVVCWGDNRFGALGDGTLVDRAKPAPVRYLTAARLPPPEDGDAHLPTGNRFELDEAPPDECPEPTDVRVRIAGGDERTLVVAAAYVVDGKPWSRVVLADFGLDPKSLRTPAGLEAVRGKRSALELRFRRVDRQPLKAARARTSSKAGTRFEVLLHERVRTRSWDEGLRGSIHLTHVNEDFICGELLVTDSVLSLSGRFLAKRL